MEDEYFKIFDEDRNEIGIASRNDVHRLGYWHETFHCWFVTKHKGKDYIYLQLRSDTKQDYPNLFDITAAGHLTSDEKVQDGVREVKEELGIDVLFNDLVPLGIMEYCTIKENFIDKEFAHVFLYKSEHSLDEFILQTEEVSGMVLAEFKDFSDLWFGEKETIKIKGFELNKEGKRMMIDKYIGKDQFAPHQPSFYLGVIQKIEEEIY
ncbi:NUDIX domain-containing protein [Bacillus sp. FJAT-50079]|nr:NUDIX domain-containing protein [Bacillus sp. FJAT-50079]